MDKVMKRLGIELASDGQDAIPMVHCNVDGRQCAGGRTTWLTTFQGYAFKSNLIIDDICNQPLEEMEVIKQALEQQFEYPNYPLAYKHVKDQVAIVMKSRCIVLKKMIERGEH